MLPHSTAHQVQIRAYNDEGWSEWSMPGSGTTAANRSPTFATQGQGESITLMLPETLGSATDSGRDIGAPITATDPDQGDSVRYSLEGTDAASFTVTSTGQVRTIADRTYDHETKEEYTAVLAAEDDEDANTGRATVKLVIEITDEEEPPLAPAQPTFTGTSRHQTTVSWTAPSNTGRPDIDNYRVRYDSGAASTERTLGDTSLSLQVTGLDHGVTYSFQVQAHNADGWGAWSEPGEATTPANRIPIFQDGSSTTMSLPENSQAGVDVGTALTATDQDGDTITYSIDEENGENEGQFAIDPLTGQLESGDHGYNYEAADHHIITVVARDSKEGRGEIEVRVNITDLNEAPDQPENLGVTQVSSIELKADWDKPNNDGRPAISGYDVQYRKDLDTATWVDANHTGTSTQASITGLEPSTTYQVQVRTVNHEGRSGWTQVSKGTTNPNNPPVFAQGSNATRSVPENSPANTNVGTPVTATDFEGTSLTYSLDVTDTSSFSIIPDNGQIQTKTGVDYNHEVKSSYSLRVKAVDRHSGSKIIPVTVTITNVIEPPGDPAAPTVTAGTAPRSLDVSWAAPANTGPDITGYDLQYRQGASGDWSPWSHTGAGRTDTITGLVAGKTHQVQVKAKNIEGESGWSLPGSGATRPNVPPNFADDRGSGTTTRAMTETIGEETDTGRNVGTPVTATDQDGGTITYALDGTDAASFDIDPLTGQISTKSSSKYDFETKSSYEVTVTANDGQEEPERTKTIAVTINITDEEEPPTKMATPTFEDTGRYETTVKWIKPSNTGRPAITKYQLRYGKNVTDPSYTVVDAGSGVKDTIDQLDDGMDYRFEVRAVNADGDSPWSDPGIVSTPANRLPVFTDGVSASRNLPENSPEDTNVGDPIAATDQDDDTREYSITGTNSGKFTVSPATGQILAGEHDYDFETTTSYTLTLEVVDRYDGEDTITVTVTITNVIEPPETPSAPTVTAGTQPRSLDVSWVAPTNTGPALNDYDLQYQRSGASSWSEWAHSGTSLSTIITGLIAGQTYHVQVKAKSPEGESNWSPQGSGDTNPNRAPTFADDGGSGTTSRSIRETLGDAEDTGRNVGTAVTATDTDYGAISYSLSVADTASFSINPSTGQISTKSGQSYDHEAKSSYSLTVTANDGQEEPDNTETIAVTISITDVNEPPVKPSPPTFSGTGRYQTTASWTPPDNTGRPAISKYQLRYGTGTDTSIHETKDTGSSLSLTVESLEDGETYNFQVRAENAEGWGPWSEFAAVTTLANQAPTFTAATATRTLDENSPAGTPAGDPIGATDGDADSLTYSVTEPNSGKFTVDPSDGQIRAGDHDYDHETTSSYALTLRVADGPGGADTTAVTVNITNVAEPPAKPEPPTASQQSLTSLYLRISGRNPSEHRSRHNRLRRPVEEGYLGGLDRCGRHHANPVSDPGEPGPERDLPTPGEGHQRRGNRRMVRPGHQHHQRQQPSKLQRGRERHPVGSGEHRNRHRLGRSAGRHRLRHQRWGQPLLQHHHPGRPLHGRRQHRADQDSGQRRLRP